MPELEPILLFAHPLQEAGIRYIITGSVAAIFYGEPRLTLDVDLVVFLNDRDISRLAEIFPTVDFYVPPIETILVEVRRERGGHFNILHSPTGFKADFYIAGMDELETWAFRNQRRIQFTNQIITLAPPEYVIVRKLEYYREGGSEKHLRDVRSILAVSNKELDYESLQDWIDRRGLQAEWKLLSGSVLPTDNHGRS